MNVEKPEICIFIVDGKEYEMDHTSTNGTEIKTIAHVSGEYSLFLEEEGDKPDRKISDGETISLSGKTKCFYSVPPATFGKIDFGDQFTDKGPLIG